MSRIEEKIKIKNSLGLHARPAAQFVKKALEFNSKILIKKDNQILDAKSIMNILSLGLERNSEVSLIVEGLDAQQAIKELKKILESEDE